MSYALAKLTVTYSGIVSDMGIQKADELLKTELSIAVPKHQDQWNRNLARAWSGLMTRQEMDSISALGRQSPHAAKFMAMQDQAGAAMKAISEPLLQAVIVEALQRATEQSIQKNQKQSAK